MMTDQGFTASARQTIDDSFAWIEVLRGAPTCAREAALAELHGLLLRAARFELSRRREQLSHVGSAEREHLAVQAADDALMAILGKLDDFRGASRFTTWAYKFALLEAGLKARRRAWQGREIPVDDEAWAAMRITGPSPQDMVEDGELLRALRDAVRSSLTPHQREVFSAIALNGVPIDVLAERRSTTRGALYKTVHDARRALRAALAEAGHAAGVDRQRELERERSPLAAGSARVRGDGQEVSQDGRSPEARV
jgi:RNA polymerase sigma-70 factor (ECF subfamily)